MNNQMATKVLKILDKCMNVSKNLLKIINYKK